MMGRPQLLVEFIDQLPNFLISGESLELVIAGDFIDFLSISPYADFTSDPAIAVAKLNTVIAHSSYYGGVFDALSRHVSRGHQLTILVGNHDVEMALPAVQSSLTERIGTAFNSVRFIDDGRAYRVGGLLIEHGNSYDGANANDWDGIRHLASAQTRARAIERNVTPSPGSRLVNTVVNNLKTRYPFIALLQPEGELLALLLLALEPTLRWDFGNIVQILSVKTLASAPPLQGERPISARDFSASYADPELQAAFGSHYMELHSPQPQTIGATKAWLHSWISPGQESISEILKTDKKIPDKQLQQIRTSIQKLLLNEPSEGLDCHAEQYGAEAQRMLSAVEGIDVVVMGHTHRPLRKKYDKGIYINSGCWVDRFTVPEDALSDETGEAMEKFLRQLLSPDCVPPLPPTYADLAISKAGRVIQAELKSFH